MTQSRVVIALLIVLTVASLAISAKYLYTTPVPNSWIFWSGDETQATQEERAQIEHGIYQYPSAYGSIYSQHSGILKGSVWLTSLIYGGAWMVTGANPVIVGRTVSFLIGLLLLVAIYFATRYFRVNSVLATFAVFLVGCSICLFMNSHSARYDVLVSVSALVVVVWLIDKLASSEISNNRKALIAGFVNGGLLVVSLHLVMGLTVAILFLLLYFRVLRSFRAALLFALPIVAWVALLSVIFYLRAGEFSLMGPFQPGLFPLPIKNVLHPRAHIGNLGFRLFVMRYWSHAVLLLLAPAIVLGIIALIRHWAIPRKYVAFFGATVLYAFAVFYTEQIVPRYHIYYLPPIVISIVLMLSLWSRRMQAAWMKTTFLVAIAIIAIWTFVDYTTYALMLGSIGDTLTNANVQAMQRAYSHLDPNERTLVEAPGQYIVGSKLGANFVSPFIVSDPIDSTVPIEERFYKNHVRQAVIVSSERVPLDDRFYEISRNYWQRYGELVYLETGKFTDIGRTYGPEGMTGVDSIKVYRLP